MIRRCSSPSNCGRTHALLNRPNSIGSRIPSPGRSVRRRAHATKRVYAAAMSAEVTRFTADADPDTVFAAIERDGVVIVEGLLSADTVRRVNDDVEAAVEAADPNEAYFNPVM